MVTTIKANSKEARIDVSTWNKGIYSIQIQSESVVVVRKVVVHK